MTDTTIKGWPWLDRVHVDGTTINGDGTAKHPLRALGGGGGSFTIDLPNGEAFTLVPGQAVTSLGDAVRLARADYSTYATVIGIVVIGAGSTLPVTIAPIGPITFSTAIWDVITGQTGGLSADATYYLDTTPGQLTTTPPGIGNYLVEVGRALTSTSFSVAPTTPLLL